MARIAFQGEVGAYSEEAVGAMYPNGDALPFPTFERVFEAVESGAAEMAMVPIENSLFGSVHANYDLLRDHDLSIVNEINLRIRHNLLVLPGVRVEDVEEVSSHPQALGQCKTFLKENLPAARIVSAYDTAGAAKRLSESRRRDAAAIASAKAADVYGLEVLAKNIESNHQNFTRFLALSSDPQPTSGPSEACKTSIVYAMRENVPGALFKSLAVFALRDIDLLKIESRPLVGSPGSYLFYLDLEGATSDENVNKALEHLTEIADYLKILGSYPKGRMTR